MSNIIAFIVNIYRNFALFVKMVVVMSILIGLNWQRINGRRFIKLRELHVVVGCVEGRSTTAKDIARDFAYYQRIRILDV